MNITDHEKQILNTHLAQIIEYTYALSTKAIWSYVEQATPEIKHQKAGFLYVLEQLLRQGKVKMGREHKLLDLSIEEVIQSFSDNWPTDEDFDDDQFCVVQPYKVPGEKLLHTHCWTPGDLVWIDPDDSHELWSTEANY